MNFGKCLFYGVIIGILVIIIIKLCKNIKENYEEIVDKMNEDEKVETENVDAVETIEEVASAQLDKLVEEEKKQEEKQVEEVEEKKEEEKGVIDSVVDAVKGVFASDESETAPVALTQDEKDDVIEGPASVDGVETEETQEILKTLPKFVDSVSSSVMDGVKMIPQSTNSAWQDVYMGEDNDNSFMIDLGGDDKKTNKDQGSGRFTDRSPACCSAQYPVPFKIHVEEGLLKNAHEYVPNPYMGNNNWMNAGCSCMKKDNASKLATRGGNA